MYGHIHLMAKAVAKSTILSFHTTLLHQGMIIVGLPYSE